MENVVVIMPCYNTQDTVKEAIESVYNQTFKDFLFIVCDDCSTDDTHNILCENNYGYSLFKNEKNIGTGWSVNKMINEICTNNELITWISADNILDVDFLQKHLEKIEEGYAITYSGWLTFGNLTIPRQLPNQNLLELKKSYRLGPSFLFRKKLWDVSEHFHELPGEDYYFAVDCALNDAKFGFIDDVLVKYRLHENSVGGRLTNKTINRICSDDAKKRAQKIKNNNGIETYK